MLFDVRIIAFDPHGSVDPVDALVRLFKVDLAFAREVVHRLPRVVKRGVTLETAQRLGHMLEKIGAQVEILVADRPAGSPQTPGERPTSERQARPERQDGAQRPSVGRGLPPPSKAALVQVPANSNAFGSQAQRARASLPEGAAGLARERDGAGFRSRERTDTGASMVPRTRVDTSSFAAHERADPPRAVPREQAPASDAQGGTAPGRRSLPFGSLPDVSFQEEAGSALRALPFNDDDTQISGPRTLKQGPLDDGLSARVSLPMRSWSEAEADDLRATRAVERGSLADPQPPTGAQRVPQRPSSVGLPPPKQSVKEILARRSLATQTADGLEHSKGANKASSASYAEVLALPTFAARGSSLVDEIDELPGTSRLRTKLAIFSVALLIVASLATVGLLPLVLLARALSQARGRLAQLRVLQASSLLVGQAQLPELYGCVKHLAIRLDIMPTPRLYVAERLPSKVQSFAVGGALAIFLDAGLIASCARRDAGYVVQFALAHEMAGHALGQHGRFRSFLSRSWSSLRKRDLFGADALAAKSMADRKEAVRALASLLCGTELVHLLDLSELDRQATSQEQELPASLSMLDPSLLLPRIQQLRRPVV